LALRGGGVGAGSHADGTPGAGTFDEIRIGGRTPERAAALALTLAPALRASVSAVPTARHAAEGADVIALVTAAREPVLRREWVRDGAHICAVGACRPDQREMETA